MVDVAKTSIMLKQMKAYKETQNPDYLKRCLRCWFHWNRIARFIGGKP